MEWTNVEYVRWQVFTDWHTLFIYRARTYAMSVVVEYNFTAASQLYVLHT